MAIEHTHKTIKDILNGKYSLDKFIVTKALRDTYANPERIAHKILADRMGERDPGNKPQTNDKKIYFVCLIDAPLKCTDYLIDLTSLF